MILFEFQLDPTVLAEDRSTDIAIADAAALQETYFVMPVRLSIDDIELLEIPVHQDERLRMGSQGAQQIVPIPWLPLPLLNVATVGLDTLEDTRRRGASYYTLPGYGWRLQFTLANKGILVYSGVNERSARVEHDELVSSFKNFASKVKSVLNQEIPELRRHLVWGSWLRETD